MTQSLAAFLTLSWLITSSFAQNPDPKRWESTIAAFEKQDKISPPTKHAILFTGSSSIALWRDLTQAFPEYPVINRGFGGSTTPDVNFYIDRIVLPYEPQIVVLYSGSNDLAAQRTPELVLADFQTFVKKVHFSLPETKVVYISIHTPPGRVKLREINRRANKLIAEECANNQKLTFVDVHDAMLAKDGKPNPDLYRDSLHPNAKGYELWKERLTPLLRDKYKKP
jgi:lysophospholipase L1-like esterase